MSEHEHLGFTFVGKLKSHCPQVSRESKVDDIVEAWLVELPLDPRRQAGRASCPCALFPNSHTEACRRCKSLGGFKQSPTLLYSGSLPHHPRSDAELRTIFQEART